MATTYGQALTNPLWGPQAQAAGGVLDAQGNIIFPPGSKGGAGSAAGYKVAPTGQIYDLSTGAITNAATGTDIVSGLGSTLNSGINDWQNYFKGSSAAAGAAAGIIGAVDPSLFSASSAASPSSGTSASTSPGATAGAAPTGATNANWLTGPSVIPGVVGAAGNIIGAAIQSNAAGNAASLNAQSVQDALNFEKQKYATLVGNLQPYINSGTSANARMTQLLGLTKNAAPAMTAGGGTGTPSGADSTAGAGNASDTVTLRAPDGSTQQFNARDPRVLHYRSRGAQVVNA